MLFRSGWRLCPADVDRIVRILGPFPRVIANVFTHAAKVLFAPDDVVVIAALPYPCAGRAADLVDRQGRGRFERCDQVSESTALNMSERPG